MTTIASLRLLKLAFAFTLATTMQAACPAHAAGSDEFTLGVAIGADPVNLDPRKTWIAQGYSINAHVFEALVMRREENGAVVLAPLLAESWTQTTPTTLELQIRHGVKFQNGEALDAAAVAYTLTSIMDPKFVTNLKLWTSAIAAVSVKDPFTLVITTKSQTRGLLNALVQLPIVAPKAAQDNAVAFGKRPIGTGPYSIVSYVPSSQVVLERSPQYWGSAGKAKTITFRIMPESSVRIAALEAGEVQVAENLPPDKLSVLQSDKDIKVLFTPTLRVDYLALNFRKPIIQNLKFREALSLAIDRESLVHNLLADTTRTANSISPPGTIGYNSSLPAYAFDPVRAKAALAESSYSNEPIIMGGPIGRYSMDKQVSEAIAGMFRNVGVNVRLETLTFGSYYAKYAQGGYDIGFIGFTDFTLNPPKHWAPLFYTKINPNMYSDTSMDRIIDVSEQELDDAKAIALFREGQALQQKKLAALPLYYEPQLIGISAKLTGFQPRLDEYVILNDAVLGE